MFRVTGFAFCLSAVLALLAPATSVSAEGLKVGGTGSANELLRIIGRAWSLTPEGANLELVPGLGSSGAIAAVADGVLDIAISGRPLKDAEQATGVRALVFAVTPYVLATSHPTAIALQSTSVAAFYSSPKSSWPDGTDVKPILRPRSESDTVLLAAMFPGMADALQSMRLRADIPIAATDQDNLDLAERIPGSLAAASLAQIVNEKRNLRMLQIDNVTPSVTALEQGAYRFVKVFHLVSKSEAPPQVVALMKFLKSPAGIDALRAAGTLPAKD